VFFSTAISVYSEVDNVPRNLIRVRCYCIAPE
jgi:hypothetical protein